MNDRAEKMALKRLLNSLGEKLGPVFEDANTGERIVLNPFDLTLFMSSPTFARRIRKFQAKIL